MEELPHKKPCDNCDLLKTVNNFSEWQHHYKYCTIYCLFFQVMRSLKGPEMNTITKVCESLDDESSRLRCVSLSKELPGPIETSLFNCDRYEEYLHLLKSLIISNEKTIDLLNDVNMYLKPFENGDRHPWMEIGFDLQHSIDDRYFAQDLIEAFKNHFPIDYLVNCHQ
jgi:hypothetical protein